MINSKKKKLSPTKIARRIAEVLHNELILHEEDYPTGRITPALVNEKAFSTVRRILRDALK